MNDDVLTAWLAWLEAGEVTASTLRNRRYTLGTFARGHDLLTATAADVAAHMDGLPGGAYSRAGHLAALRSFYFWCQGSGLRPDDPTAIMRSVRVHAEPKDPCPRGRLDRALILSKPDVRFMLLLGSRAGLRREEIATLHSTCVHGRTLVIVGKGRKQRRIPVHPSLRPHLDDLVRHPGWAFPSHVKPGQHVTPETIQRRVTAALGGGWTTHSLRRRAATDWYNATNDLRAVQELLGHSDPSTTARYVHADTDRMTAAVLAVA
jgi:integrase